jgi:hypothetical protein
LEVRVTRYHLSPKTTVFTAVTDGRVTHTVSLIRDSELGLPVEDLYGAGVRAMRQQGLALAEASCLAASAAQESRRVSFERSVDLMGLMVQSARQQGVQRLLLAVHPKHAKFYVDWYGCVVFGQEQAYSTVKGKPAVGCFHDFAETDRAGGYKLRERVYGVAYADAELTPTPMSMADVTYFLDAAGYCGSGWQPAI